MHFFLILFGAGLVVVGGVLLSMTGVYLLMGIRLARTAARESSVLKRRSALWMIGLSCTALLLIAGAWVWIARQLF
ncbi:MAG TPA: hypothetical protein VHK69_22030 [Chitinophagaceae bacterium]|nr:hypothetical protein [Chitinophagaceae bacterium]